MNRFTKSIRIALNAQDWHGALMTALALPDICGKLETPEEGSKSRSIKWFNKWMIHNYTHSIGPFNKRHVFLCGNDFYALRCALLHEGSANIDEQNSQKTLYKFHFIIPPQRGCRHNNLFNNKTLQLQVDMFCNEVAEAVGEWAKSVENDNNIQKRIKSLLIIHD